MKIICTADTHKHVPEFTENGALFLHAGDAGCWDNIAPLSLVLQAVRHRVTSSVYIAGNHDRVLANAAPALPFATYLCDQEIVLALPGARRVVRIYGSPWTPNFGGWPFMLPRNGDLLHEKRQMIPAGLDILVTHTPPWGTLDVERGMRQGCELLAERLEELGPGAPRLHVFGHIHGGYGVVEKGHTIYVNASHCGYPSNKPINPPPVVDLNL